MKIIAGSYTSMGGPGLALLRWQANGFEVLDTTDAVKEAIWAEKSKKGPVLFVAGAREDGVHTCVASFAVSEDGFTLLSRQESDGMECCHLCLDEAEKFLYAANYGDGSVSVFPIEEDGKIGGCMQQMKRNTPLGPRADRQERNHAHQVCFRPGTKELFLCDLGADQVAIFRVGADGTLTEKTVIACMPGSGPRHLSFDGPDAFYLAGELDTSLSRYAYDGQEWQCVQHLSALPAGYEKPNTAAAIRQDGQHVYVSNRGHDSIAVFAKDGEGKLKPPYFIRTPGACPRDFQLLGAGFLLAHQQSGTVTCINESGVPVAQVHLPGAVSLLLMDP